MTDDEERAYQLGEQAAFRQMLRTCLRNLHSDGRTLESIVAERSETIALLRRLCASYGDNDWADDLHLVDIIEKHLWVHLEDTETEEDNT